MGVNSKKECLCVICHQEIPFDLSRRSWRKTCGSPICEKEHTKNRRSRYDARLGEKEHGKNNVKDEK
jgi:hypothetical protein